MLRIPLLWCGIGLLSVLSAAETQIATPTPEVPGTDALMQLLGEAPHWSIGPLGETDYVMTYPRPAPFSVVDFPDGTMRYRYPPFSLLLMAGPLSWMALLMNGGEDLASRCDINLYAQRFSWDTSDAALAARAMAPVTAGKPRSTLERLLAVRLLHAHGAVPPQVAGLTDPNDAFLGLALRGRVPPPAGLVSWIIRQPLHDALVIVWQPGAYPALRSGMGAMHGLADLTSIMFASAGRERVQRFPQSTELVLSACQWPFEFARAFGNVHIDRAVVSMDLSRGAVGRGRFPSTSMAAEGRGLDAVLHCAEAYGMPAATEPSSCGNADWTIQASPTSLTVVHPPAPAAASGPAREDAIKSWAGLGLDTAAFLWIRMTQESLSTLPPMGPLPLLGLQPGDDLVLRLGDVHGDTVLTLSVPAHCAAGAQAVAAWFPPALAWARTMLVQDGTLMNPVVFLDALKMQAPVVQTDSHRSIVSLVIPGMPMRDLFPLKAVMYRALAPAWPEAYQKLAKQLASTVSVPGR